VHARERKRLHTEERIPLSAGTVSVCTRRSCPVGEGERASNFLILFSRELYVIKRIVSRSRPVSTGYFVVLSKSGST